MTARTPTEIRQLSERPEPLALLAHELRTPLNALVGYAEAMSAEVFGPLPPPYVEQARIMHAAARHLADMVGRLAVVSDEDAPPVETLDPGAVARDVAALLAPRAAALGLSLHTLVDPNLPCAVADRRGLTQILLNLLDNALKFTGPGGWVRLSLTRDDRVLNLAVSDSGRSTGPGAGSPCEGLGLAVARAICVAHGGSLTLESVAPAGTMATARLVVFPEASAWRAD